MQCNTGSIPILICVERVHVIAARLAAYQRAHRFHFSRLNLVLASRIQHDAHEFLALYQEVERRDRRPAVIRAS